MKQIKWLLGLTVLWLSWDGMAELNNRFSAWECWVDDNRVGKVIPVAAGGENEQGALRIVPVAGDYYLQTYRDTEAKPDKKYSYTLRLKASDEVNPETELSILVKALNAAGQFVTLESVPLKRILLQPGVVQQETLTVDLPLLKGAGVGQLRFSVAVTGLKDGEITLLELTRQSENGSEPVKMPKLSSSVPGFAALRLEAVRWPTPGTLELLNKMLEHTPLGVHEFRLPQSLRAIALQWTGKEVIQLERVNDGWKIVRDDIGNNAGRILKVSEPVIGVYGGGFWVRNTDGSILADVPGGLTGKDLALLYPEDSKAPVVTKREIYPEALRTGYLLEAQKNMVRAKALFHQNLAWLQCYWKTDLSDYRNKGYVQNDWESNFRLLDAEITTALDAANQTAGGWLVPLFANKLLHDRYNTLISSSDMFYIKTGYMGEYIQQSWFSHLGGSALYVNAAQYLVKTERLVARARRLTAAAFAEGYTLNPSLALGWVDNLTAVPRGAGLPVLSKTATLYLARGESEGMQLVLTTGAAALDKVTVTVKGADYNGLKVQPYLVEYLRMSESSSPNLPPVAGGDAEHPDVLAELVDRNGFSIPAWSNQPIWLTLSAAAEAQPGKYELAVTVQVGEDTVTVPYTVQVVDFKLEKQRLDNIAGMRYDSIPMFYGNKNEVQYRRNLMARLLEYRLNPLDLYAATPPLDDVRYGIKQWGLDSAVLDGIDEFAPPQPGLAQHLLLFGSVDGKRYVPVRARAELVKTTEVPALDYDLVVYPEEDLSRFRLIKLHNSEIRQWDDRCPYSYFFMDTAMQPVEVTDGSGKVFAPKTVRYYQPDRIPVRGESGTEFTGRSFAFDRLRDDLNQSSVVFEKKINEPLQAIRLRNCNLSNRYSAMKKRHTQLRQIGGKSFKIYAYGFDETGRHLNQQMLQSLKLVKELFPDVITVSTAADPAATPEIFQYLDIHTPTNLYSLPREEQRIQKQYGTRFWSYVGGGGYYPYGNFERVDQPILVSRAFFWPMAQFALDGFLYFDIHMWRFNFDVPREYPLLWSVWDSTWAENMNGMSAIFYPGIDGKSYPSIRAEAMRDGIEDVLMLRQAQEKLADLKASAEYTQWQSQYENLRNKLASSMSVYVDDAATLQAIRRELLQLNETLSAAGKRKK